MTTNTHEGDNMTTDKAREVLAELGSILGDQWAEAINIVLEDHDRLRAPRTRRGSREEKVLEYMTEHPNVPLTPGAVQAATGLQRSPASAMANLAQKGRIRRYGNSAIYTYQPEPEEVPAVSIPAQRVAEATKSKQKAS